MKTIRELEAEEYQTLGCGRAIVRHKIKALKDVIKLIEPMKDKIKKVLVDWNCNGIPLNYTDVINDIIDKKLKERIEGTQKVENM